MYYLQSRYYDPEVGRFINCDDVNYIGIWLIQTKPLHPTIYSDQSVMNFIPFADVFLLDDNSRSILEYIGF